MDNKEIGELEIAVRDRYGNNPSTTERAFDKEYISMLTKLRDAYTERNSPKIRDSLGWNASDARRVIVYNETLQKLEKEHSAFASQFFEDPDR